MGAKRIAVVDRDLCNPHSCGYACQKACPVNRSGDECITISPDDRKVLIDEGLCIGCGICVKKCPKDAIMIVNLPQELNETPIHRYGKNMFSLYRLPVPKSGAVVGLIGPNGVGKSTVINILSGNLMPNTGMLDKEVPWENVIERFKGTELQPYLEALSKKRIKSAYKPQNIDKIPELWKGKVRELLEKIDERKIMKDIVSRLGAREMMEKDIASLSGGELQVMAVTATILREADFYFFDEPSSYLDVQERLIVAKEIRRLAESSTVMVVEHDLAVADYLADYVHILYGKPGAFGIVSKPYAVRTGINTYLEGYIKEENVRFREESIIFSKRAKDSQKNKLFMSFPELEKRLGSFELKTEAGNIYRGEVIGILGPNGTGKTTFVKMLSGNMEADKGEVKADAEVSYKPQRIVFSEKEAVMAVEELIKYKSGSDTRKSENKRLLRLLGIERLLERSAGKISGGELQAVFIAASIMKKHDILFMDEPSAFLDVEERLRVAKLIRSHCESKEVPAFVVDHDLQFIDAISDRVMVFEGERGMRGYANPPFGLKDGMNKFLMSMGISFRRDGATGRPRANKPGSQKDIEQKNRGEYYYMG